MEEEFQKHIKILSDVDKGEYVKKESAEFFLKLLKEGKDITEAVPLLKQLYNESHQVPVMEPAADAFILYHIQHGNVEEIRDFIQNGEYTMFPFESMQRLTEQGVDITVILPVIIDFYPQERYKASDILTKFAMRDKSTYSEKLSMIAEMVANNENASGCLGGLVRDGAMDDLDMGPVLPVLINLLSNESKNVREDAASSMRWAVEALSDFSSVTGELEKIIKKDDDLAVPLSYCLGYFYTRKKNWNKIEELLESSKDNVRLGIYRALSVRFHGKSKRISQVQQFILGGLNDQSESIRKMIFNSLEQAPRKKIKIIPADSQVLVELIEGFKSIDENQQLNEYLYLVAMKNDETARLIVETLEKKEYALIPIARDLKKKVNLLLKGEISPVCSICRNIPRSKIYSFKHDVPKEYRKLDNYKPPSGYCPVNKVCPECGTFYHYDYEEEWDDMSLDITITLQRLDPVDVLRYLNEPDKKEYEKKIPGILEQFRKDLDHPVQFKVDEAAWVLTRYTIHEQDWDEIKEMLESKNKILRKNAFLELFRAGIDKFPRSRFEPYFRAMLDDEDDSIRIGSANALALIIIKRNDFEDLTDMLEHPDDGIKLATLRRISSSVYNEKLDISPIEELITSMSASENEDLQYTSNYILEDWMKHSKNVMTVFLKNLQHDDARVRENAAYSLRNLANKKKDISKAIPGLIELLKDDETVYSALEALRSAVNYAKVDISEAFPTLVEMMKDPSRHRYSDISWLLYQCKEKGLDISSTYEIMGKNMWELDKNKQGSEDDIFRKAMENDEDLSVIEPYLEKCLTKRLDDYWGDSVVYILTYIYLKQEKWDKIIFLLEHDNKNIPGPCANTLEQYAADIEPLVPVLAKNILGDYWYTRNRAAWALIKFGRRSKANLDLVKEHVKKLVVKDIKDEKKLEPYNEVLHELDIKL
ncbi:MAG: HEAT repeat domain-containing protein [Candidatus Hodarchaeota archaeon]